GLCRTEHMFFDEDRIRAVREMILADDEKTRRAALAKLLPMQRGDFAELFEIMRGLPVTIRLLDPPLHEFLPHGQKDMDEVAAAVMKETGAKLDYQVGTMIELPRAALLAQEIAESAEFFSFGTNDLTQTTFGISRDDAASFLGIYVQRGILPDDPFVSIDREG